jgi:hypothetical protein
MNPRAVKAKLLIVLFLFSAVLTNKQVKSKSQAAGDLIEGGKYIVEQVTLCTECHRPRDEKGNLQRTEYLKGAPVLVKSPYPEMKWALKAPAIAGLPGYTEERGIRLLTEGNHA